jgi:predicted Ser/Thr protein kinase/tetratricopeptide (TPR) repeat protein
VDEVREDAPDRARHERAKEIFLDALDAPRARRLAFIAAACPGDEQLRREVLELLVLHGEADSVLDAPLDGAAALAGLSEPSGATIGPYRLVRELGRGGMGVVHLAEKDGHAFAIKVLGAGAVSPEVRERFRLEAEILGRLHHDSIARIVEVGEVIGPGSVPQPWIAMEYVDGVSLHEYAEREKLELEPRLRLLATICDAVQHAHTHGVVHRDLKPANILVRADGRPVVLDFGVARLAGGDERPTELLTRTGQWVGTPQYMSPEQVQAEPAGITPASDVYSLGVIAYELIAGRLPYEATSVSVNRAMAIILTVEPPPLGTVDRRFRGALERVVSKALEKEPADRYPQAGEFADDLRRKLDGRAVRAHGPRLSRRVARWTHQQRLLVASALTVLFLGLLVVTWIVATRRRTVPRETITAAYREAETLQQQAVPLLYEGERTPSRLRQAIDLYSRARLLIEQVPPLRTHDRLLRVIEKDLGTAQLVLGELTWDLQPYRAAAVTLQHAVTLSPDTLAGSEEDIQLQQLGIAEDPQRDLYGLLEGTYLGQYRLWGESNALQGAQYWVRVTRAEFRRAWGEPSPPAGAGVSDPWAYLYNSFTEITHEAAWFRADTALAHDAVLYSDSAVARRNAFLQDWPALGSMLFERGRALRAYGTLTGSRGALESSARYLQECADYRGPERPWVFAQTRQEMASLALDRARLEAHSARRVARLWQARRDVDTALRVLRPTELPEAASASFRSLDAELLAELALAERRPGLLVEAEARLREASRAFPSTALPREAALVCVRQAVLARARYVSTGNGNQLVAGNAALDRALVLMEAHTDSLVMFRVQREREALSRARDAGLPLIRVLREREAPSRARGARRP